MKLPAPLRRLKCRLTAELSTAAAQCAAIPFTLCFISAVLPSALLSVMLLRKAWFLPHSLPDAPWGSLLFWWFCCSVFPCAATAAWLLSSPYPLSRHTLARSLVFLCTATLLLSDVLGILFFCHAWTLFCVVCAVFLSLCSLCLLPFAYRFSALLFSSSMLTAVFHVVVFFLTVSL